MSLSSFQYPSIFKLFCFSLILPYIISGPVPKTFYEESISSLIGKNCQMPKEIYIPFKKTSEPKPFDYLSAPLKECQKTQKALQDDTEAYLFCKEIFEVIHDITCSQFNTSLPQIKGTYVTDEVCTEFIAMKDILPKEDEHIAGRLVDGIICKVLCSNKYKSLCQTLLWSYDLQAQIKNAVEKNDNATNEITNKVAPEQDAVAAEKNIEDTNEGVNNNVPNYDAATADKSIEDKIGDSNNNVPKNEVAENEGDVNKVQQEPLLDVETKKQKYEEQAFNNQNTEMKAKNINNELDGNSLDATAPISGSSTFSSKPKNLDATLNAQKGTEISSLSNLVQSRILFIENETKIEKPTEVQMNNGIKDVNFKNNDKVKNEKPKLNENKVNDNAMPEVSQINNQQSKSSGGIPKNNKESSTETAQNVGNIKSTVGSVQTNTILAGSIPSNKPEENELNSVNFEEEKEPKETVKQADVQVPGPSDEDKNTENLDETISKISTKSTTMQIYPDRNVEEDSNNRDTEPDYNDTENEDYSKSEYESTLIDLQAKKQSIKSSVVSEVASPNDDVSNNNNMPFSRKNFGRGEEDIPMIPSPFAEQEDSHFFFYFLSIVLILMAGYLLFHNKQKIIALIVEGRHERRRRSHGAGYKKLDAK